MKIGTMLPISVLVEYREDGRIEVSAVDPVASMQITGRARAQSASVIERF